MKYLVTHAVTSVPGSRDHIDADLTLSEALALAGRLIADGQVDVTIMDMDVAEKEIYGEELAACCRGEKTLTPDLRAVAKV
jgi:hypothetical protein